MQNGKLNYEFLKSMLPTWRKQYQSDIRYAALKPTKFYNQHCVPHAYIWKHLMLPNICMWYIMFILRFCWF